MKFLLVILPVNIILRVLGMKKVEFNTISKVFRGSGSKKGLICFLSMATTIDITRNNPWLFILSITILFYYLACYEQK